MTEARRSVYWRLQNFRLSLVGRANESLQRPQADHPHVIRSQPPCRSHQPRTQRSCFLTSWGIQSWLPIWSHSVVFTTRKDSQSTSKPSCLPRVSQRSSVRSRGPCGSARRRRALSSRRPPPIPVEGRRSPLEELPGVQGCRRTPSRLVGSRLLRYRRVRAAAGLKGLAIP